MRQIAKSWDLLTQEAVGSCGSMVRKGLGTGIGSIFTSTCAKNNLGRDMLANIPNCILARPLWSPELASSPDTARESMCLTVGNWSALWHCLCLYFFCHSRAAELKKKK